MFIQPIVGWVKSLAEQFQKPATYGSALEAYIASKNPQNTADIDMLTRQYEHNIANRQGWLA
jgi:hypothetical protein